MKNLKLIIAGAVTIGASLVNIACTKSEAAAAAEVESMPENGAQFKAGRGLDLTDEMKKSIGLAVAEVAEEKIAPVLSITLDSVEEKHACGWLSPADAAQVANGMAVELEGGEPFVKYKGVVQTIEKMPAGALGESEITITSEETLPNSGTLKATFRGKESDVVPVVPKSALLKTAEGSFVYAVNDGFYVRTPVTTGPTDGELVEITDGLYTGDQIVTTPVMSLWMAELQVLRGGKACTCGH
jgi:hypothetical protein